MENLLYNKGMYSRSSILRSIVIRKIGVVRKLNERHSNMFSGITKHHSNQYVRCWKQWRMDVLVDVLCPSGAYEKVFWWFLDIN